MSDLMPTATGYRAAPLPWARRATLSTALHRVRSRATLGFLAVVAAVSLAYPTAVGALQSTAATSADLFVRGLVTRDADLGWQQLCSTLRTQLTSADLREVLAGRRADGLGVALGSRLVDVATRPDGAHDHTYVLSATSPDGRTERRMLVVRTQPSGCVSDAR